MRVLSLLPAATEIVASLGALDGLVGVTHECDWPPAVRSLPRVTASALDAGAGSAAGAGEVDARVRELSAAGAALFVLDEALLARLRPDVILTQALCDVCAVSETDVRAVAARLAPAPRVVTLSATTLDGVLDGDVARVAEAIGRADAGAALAEELRGRMRRVHETLRAARAPRPRVAVIEWTDPVYAAGHWVPEMVRRAGGVDVLASAGEHSTTRAVEAVASAGPDLLLFAPCGYDAPRAADEARRTLARPEWRWAASRPAWAVDANAYVSRPGPRLVEGVELFARVMHPGLFGEPEEACAVRVA
ncbi:MAG: ABC transporter substrate-binding protein [Gemmatimonadaceae bacterium]